MATISIIVAPRSSLGNLSGQNGGATDSEGTDEADHDIIHHHV